MDSTEDQARLYPRMRGADPTFIGTSRTISPLPPRARGWLGPCHFLNRSGPSTPACAGLTSTRAWTGSSRTLYPRMRGADSVEDESVLYEVPPPPRARG